MSCEDRVDRLLAVYGHQLDDGSFAHPDASGTLRTAKVIARYGDITAPQDIAALLVELQKLAELRARHERLIDEERQPR